MNLTKQNNLVIDYKKTNDILKAACTIIDKSKEYAYKVVDISLLQRNWLLGYQIAEEELKKEIENQKTMFYLNQKWYNWYGDIYGKLHRRTKRSNK